MAPLKNKGEIAQEERGRTKSPFLARTYGGFTQEQEEFYRLHVGNLENKTVLDPMGGQGFTLSRLAYEGADVWIGDINPGPLHLAMLRDPRLVAQSSKLSTWF